MATYCIGDVQGCFDELEQLLERINYNHKQDHLWFVGDLVNRGPKSLEVLRFVKQLPNTKIVLGNHDLHLLNFYNKIVDFETAHLEPILTAPDGLELINWLRHQPLLYYDEECNAVLVHAGVYPGWSLPEAMARAREVEVMLQGANYLKFLKHLYGNEPNSWSDSLSGFDRLRFIVNAFTRMRFCDLQGGLDFTHSEGITTISITPQETNIRHCEERVKTSDEAIQNTPRKGLLPWFKIPWRKTKDTSIFFGHWATLEGQTNEPNVFALDTGCVWGGNLTAMRLDDGARFVVSSSLLSHHL